MEKVFKALADNNRRKILDIIKLNPGITLQKLCEQFTFSRYAVMKHLKLLEEAQLVVPQREGKFKHFYLNTIPIQMIYDRWLSEYTKYWSTNLTKLKYTLEMEDIMDSSQDKQIYVLYIKTSQEKLWQAITSPDLTQQYFFNTQVQSDFQSGSPISYLQKNTDGGDAIPVKGKILEVEPQKRLVHTFQHNFGDNQKSYTEESRVTYEIEPMGELVKLTVVHDQFRGDIDTYQSTSGGWPMILNSLKTLLESGKPLTFPSSS
jgi:uncharacterized protein YndB with AHSA1/START domain